MISMDDQVVSVTKLTKYNSKMKLVFKKRDDMEMSARSNLPFGISKIRHRDAKGNAQSA